MTEEALKKERGKRVKSLRRPTRLSRRAFCLKHGVPPGTMQYWEDGNFGGLSEDGAYRLVRAFNREGIITTPEWLMFGMGADPIFDAFSAGLQNSSGLVPVEDNIARELKLFYQHHPRATHEIMPDDSMEPRFVAGEYIAGVQQLPFAVKNILGHDCIIKTKSGHCLIRRVVEQLAEDKLRLKALNSDYKAEASVLKIKDIIQCAVIIWARREK